MPIVVHAVPIKLGFVWYVSLVIQVYMYLGITSGSCSSIELHIRDFIQVFLGGGESVKVFGTPGKLTIDAQRFIHSSGF